VRQRARAAAATVTGEFESVVLGKRPHCDATVVRHFRLSWLTLHRDRLHRPGSAS
jgi:hypothetical protein